MNAGLRYDIFEIPQPPMPNTLTPLTTYYTSTINIPKDQFAASSRAGVSIDARRPWCAQAMGCSTPRRAIPLTMLPAWRTG